MRLGFSGAAPISHNILKDCQSIGIPIREGYGMKETTGITHMSDEGNFKLGTVGKALPETEVRIAEDGEILVKHKGIIKRVLRLVLEVVEERHGHAHYCYQPTARGPLA